MTANENRQAARRETNRRDDRRLAGRRVKRVVVLLFCTTSLAMGATVEGMHFDDALRLDNRKLVLNGIGVRAVAWFKGYVAALYLPEKSADAEAVYVQPGPKRIAVRMLVDASPDLLSRTFGDGIRKNYKDDALEALRPRMETFDAEVRSIPGGVRQGQEIDLDFEPKVGTRILVGGKPIGEPIPGGDLYVALLKMFVGERAIDKNLRAALLGASAP